MTTGLKIIQAICSLYLFFCSVLTIFQIFVDINFLEYKLLKVEIDPIILELSILDTLFLLFVLSIFSLEKIIHMEFMEEKEYEKSIDYDINHER